MKINIILNILVALLINLSAINVYASNSTDKDAQIKIRCNRENNEVYYRINDTLYKAHILEDSIGEPEVIWQSDILKNVHWLWK